jgi:hypothetical protein
MELMDNLRIYTAKEVAVILKISKTEVQNLEKEGALLPIDWSSSLNRKRKRRRFIRYSHETLMTFLNGNK